MTDTPKSNSTRSSVSQAEILRSAREQIEKKGILGLRVAEVAEGAHCSLTQIYRYFGDRDGLLARVLGDVYEEALDKTFNFYMSKMYELPVITIDDIISYLPTPSQYAAMTIQEVRLQILATSAVNEQLRNRLEEISQRHLVLWEDALDYIEGHMEPGVKIDRRMFTIMLLVQTMYYRTLLGDKGFTDEEYRQFLRDKLCSN